MVKRVYKYTSNMPSGNPFTWFFDDEQGCAFGTSQESYYWSKQPKKGDVITYWKFGDWNEITDSVYINGELVFKRTNEVVKRMLEDEDVATERLISETRNRLGII